MSSVRRHLRDDTADVIILDSDDETPAYKQSEVRFKKTKPFLVPPALSALFCFAEIRDRLHDLLPCVFQAGPSSRQGTTAAVKSAGMKLTRRVSQH